MWIAALLGFLQGTAEWLPVSSEGVVAAVYAFALEKPLDEAVSYALWLHLGTVVSALIFFRREVLDVTREVISHPLRPSPLVFFLVTSTIISVAIGFPLLVALGEVSERVGAVAMGLVGLFMFVTGAIQLKQRRVGVRDRTQVSFMDALLAGVAQGLAVLPGLSRSGLTVAALLARQVDKQEALVISFLMSIPVSLGAAIYSGITSDLIASTSGIVATLVAFAVGLASLKVLLLVARRVNFGAFVLAVGALILAGAIWQAFFSVQ